MSTFSTLRQQAGLSVAEVAAETGYCERTAYRWERGEREPRKAVTDLLRTIKPSIGAAPGDSTFTFIDLFAGIGGIRRGFEGIGGRCVFTSEWDKYAAKTYAANFPDDDHRIVGDITKVPSSEIPDHDLLLAGFPCQPFSIAGVSKKNALNRPHGFACETQGTLFHDVARIIRDKQPTAFVLENVKNLVSHDKGNTFRIITSVLKEELGYHITTRVIDGKSFVPQHRERIIIVGFREANGFSLDSMSVPDPLQGPKLGSILHRKGDPAERPFTNEDGLPDARYTLTDHLWRYLQGYAEKHRLKGNGFGFGLVGPKDVARTLSARYYKDGSEILIDQGEGAPRRLTPRECARLMGFDCSGRSPMKIPVSDTQAYKQFGNSVVVPVIEAVARHMQPSLLQAVAKVKGGNAANA
ncbi:Dcm Site-specific DNA methylase [Rhabdaerophilaceae bacterium]